MKKNFINFLVILTVVFFYKCSEEDKQKKIVDEPNEEQIETNQTKIFYQIPSPLETYSFLYYSGVSFFKGNLNDPKNYQRYLTKEKKALNFGVYASNLAYCVIFQQNNYIIDYFNVCKKIADDLGLLDGFDEKLVISLEKNITNPDSTYQITNNSYFYAVKFLEQRNLSDIIPLVLTGSWIETVNTISKSIKKFDKKDPLVKRLIDEQYSLENLLSIYETFNVAEIYKKYYDILKNLHSFYLQIDNEKGITNRDFEKITNEIKKLRAIIIS